MSFLLDTDICSAHLKGVGAVTGRLLQYTGRLHVSVVTAGELYTWAFRAGAAPRRHTALRELFEDVVMLDVDAAVAERFGRLGPDGLAGRLMLAGARPRRPLARGAADGPFASC